MELASPGAFAVALAGSIVSSIVVYWHAERHGSRHPTAWGIFGFFFAAPGAIVYFGYYLLTRRRSRGAPR